MDDEIAATREIDTLEAFAAMVAPYRLQLLEIFRSPATVKYAAAELGVPATRLYYHVNALVAHGLLQIVSERKVGAMTERRFCVTANTFRPSRAFMDRYGPDGLEEVVRLTFRSAEAALGRAIQFGGVTLDERDSERVALGYYSIWLSPEHLEDLVGKLNELLRDIPDDENGIPVAGLVALFPRADS